MIKLIFYAYLKNRRMKEVYWQPISYFDFKMLQNFLGNRTKHLTSLSFLNVRALLSEIFLSSHHTFVNLHLNSVSYLQVSIEMADNECVTLVDIWFIYMANSFKAFSSLNSRSHSAKSVYHIYTKFKGMVREFWRENASNYCSCSHLTFYVEAAANRLQLDFQFLSSLVYYSVCTFILIKSTSQHARPDFEHATCIAGNEKTGCCAVKGIQYTLTEFK